MIQRYRQMADDPLRIEAFARAISAVVRPGDVVTEIGCGLGLFSVLAVRAGAARVYAVEDGPIIEAAREVVACNGCAERVTFLPGHSTALDVPERARVVLFEDYVAGLVNPRVARTVADIRARWLADDGLLVPPRAWLHLSAVEDDETWHAIDRFALRGERVVDIDLSPTRPRALATAHARLLPARALLGAPLVAGELELGQLSRASIGYAGTQETRRSGVVHGLLLWFALDMGPAVLDTGPEAPRSPWQQLFFPLRQPLAVERGERLELAINGAAFLDSMVWRWSLAARGGRSEASSLEGEPMRADLFRRGSGDYVPSASGELLLDRAILDAVDGRRSIAEIAGGLIERFPDRFAGHSQAQQRVAELLARYGA